MSRKATGLTKLNASVLEVRMRCRTEWPVGLVDEIAQVRQTTVLCVNERQHILRFAQQYNLDFKNNL